MCGSPRSCSHTSALQQSGRLEAGWRASGIGGAAQKEHRKSPCAAPLTCGRSHPTAPAPGPCPPTPGTGLQGACRAAWQRAGQRAGEPGRHWARSRHRNSVHTQAEQLYTSRPCTVGAEGQQRDVAGVLARQGEGGLPAWQQRRGGCRLQPVLVQALRGRPPKAQLSSVPACCISRNQTKQAARLSKAQQGSPGHPLIADNVAVGAGRRQQRAAVGVPRRLAARRGGQVRLRAADGPRSRNML